MKCLDKDVKFCDNHLLIALKPAEMETQPTFAQMVKAWVKKKYQKPGNVFLEPIHRLDKPVSGLVIFARTSKALSRLQAMLRNHEIEKTYEALVEGTPPHNTGTLKHHLRHGSHKAILDPAGKEAILHYKVLEKKGKTTLLEIDLETGRYHQIRAQLSAIGCPIVGDEKYGSKMSYSSGIALAHVKVTFSHPVTKEKLTIVL